jgi:hypothetical protein
MWTVVIQLYINNSNFKAHNGSFTATDHFARYARSIITAPAGWLIQVKLQPAGLLVITALNY